MAEVTTYAIHIVYQVLP